MAKNEQLSVSVDFAPQDLGTLCICAIRYCMGRQTYMPDLVRGIVRPLLPKLDDKDILVMLDDCEFQAKTHQWGDDTIDKPGWIRWKAEIEAELDRRTNNG